MVDSYEIFLDKISVIYRTKVNLDLNFEFGLLCRHLLLPDFDEEQFESLKIGGYRYNYVYKLKNRDDCQNIEGTIYIGICLNSPAD